MGNFWGKFWNLIVELRRRILHSAIVLILTTTLGLVFYEPLFAFFMRPIIRANEHFKTDEDLRKLQTDAGMNPDKNVIQLQETKPLALMIILMKAAFWVGLIVTAPYVLYHAWALLAPVFHQKTAGFIKMILVGGVLFFIGGAALCYFLIFPFTLDFLVWLNISLKVLTRYASSEYISLLVTFMLIFGLVFELPVIAAVLARIGLLSPRLVTKYWRFITFGIFVLGVIVSPSADLISYLMMCGVLLMLYIISIGVVYIFYSGRRGAEAETDDAGDAGDNPQNPIEPQ